MKTSIVIIILLTALAASAQVGGRLTLGTNGLPALTTNSTASSTRATLRRDDMSFFLTCTNLTANNSGGTLTLHFEISPDDTNWFQEPALAIILGLNSTNSDGGSKGTWTNFDVSKWKAMRVKPSENTSSNAVTNITLFYYYR